jgi:hypothetical protein
MEFTGRVKKIMPRRSGVSQRTGNEWQSLPFIFEFFEHETDHYSQKVVLETFDANVINNLKENMEVRCGFEHRIREYEGKTYNEIRLYKIETLQKAQNEAPQEANAPAAGNQPAPQPQAAQEAANQANDDLPF